jgi:LytS/YehU family sensor histidine kinase
VDELYHAPDPNHTKSLLKQIGLILTILLAFALVLFLVIRRYRIIIRKKEEKNKLNQRIHQLEFKAIRSQMNPHLLSNSLAAIQDLILQGKEKESALYLARFNLFLRKVLDVSDKTFVNLNQELEIVHLYIGLEQLRFPEQFDFKMEIAPEIDVETVLVPSLILQPFIENAIWHGLIPLGKKRFPKLRIQITHTSDSLTILIHDNGVGRPGHPIKKSSKGTQLIAEKLHAIGNLQDTLQCNFKITDLTENEQPSGTLVTLHITYHDPIDTY